MRWYQYTVEEFERTTNPGNAQIIVMSRQDHQQYAGDPTYVLEPAGRVALGLALSKTDRHYMYQRRSVPRDSRRDGVSFPEEEEEEVTTGDTAATGGEARSPRCDLNMILEGIRAIEMRDTQATTSKAIDK